MMTDVTGASADADQALVSDSAPADRHPSGFDPSREVLEVTPAMNAAWCAYVPPFDILSDLTMARIIGAVRHAFYAGYAASAIKAAAAGETRGAALGAQHESAVPQADAQPPVGEPAQ